MNIAEITIHHILWGNPGMLHVTPDHTKCYFLLDNRLVYIQAEVTFRGMSEEELKDLVQKEIDALKSTTH